MIEEAGPGISDAHASRGCAFGDFDNDGDMDVLVMNMNEPPSLLRNDVSSGGHWLKVLLIGVQSNRSAIGTRVTARYGARRQAQEVLAQSSFYSCNDRRLHFGLGAETSADLTIRWTNGSIETIANVNADQLVVIREGTGVIRKQKFSDNYSMQVKYKEPLLLFHFRGIVSQKQRRSTVSPQPLNNLVERATPLA